MDALLAHFSPKPLVIAERYRFHKRDQLPGESIATYVAELRRFGRPCNFGTNLDDCLRDRLVCGWSNTHIIKKMLAEKDLDLSKAIQLATESETASRDAMELGKTPVPASVHKLAPYFESTIVDDVAVSRTGADSLTCSHRGVLPLWSHWSSPTRLSLQRYGMPCMRQEGTHFSRLSTEEVGWRKEDACDTAVEETSEDDDVFALHNCTTAETHKILRVPERSRFGYISPKVNGCQVQMELDTGSALTILPASMFHEHLTCLFNQHQQC